MPHFRYTYYVKYKNTSGEPFSLKPTFNSAEALESAKTLVEVGKIEVVIIVSKLCNTVMNKPGRSK